MKCMNLKSLFDEETFFTKTTAYLLFAIMSGLVIAVAYFIHQEHVHVSEEHFHHGVERKGQEIVDIIKAYEKLLKDGVSIYRSNNLLTQAEWKNALKAQQMKSDYPGAVEMGIAWSEGCLISTVGNCLEKQCGISETLTKRLQSQNIFGKRGVKPDILLERYHDKRCPQIDLAAFYPLIESDGSIGGYVYVALDSKEMFKAFLERPHREIDVEIYDGSSTVRGNLIYRSSSLSHTSRFNTLKRMEVGGRMWTVRYTSSQISEANLQWDVSMMFGIGGIFLNGLVLWFYFALIRKRREKEAEHCQVLQSETRLKTLLSSAADGVHILDSQGDLLYWSDYFLRMLGYTENEVSELNVADWDAGFSPEELPKMVDKCFDKVITFETLHRRKDGSLFEVEVTAKPIVLDNRTVLYCSARDITERKKRLDELHMLQELVDESNDMIFIVKMDNGYIEYVNKHGIEGFGYTRDELNKIGIQAIRKPLRGDETFGEHLEELKQKGRMIDYAYVLCKDGSEKLMEMHVHAHEYKGILYNIAIGRDITEQEEDRRKIVHTSQLLKEREENLKKINEHLSELVQEEAAHLVEKEKLLMQQSKMAAMGEMVGMIAHQWRQPLNALSSAAIRIKMLSELGELNEDQLYESLKFIGEMTQKMSSTINDFMEFAKPERDKELFGIDEVVQDVLKIIEGQLRSHSIEFKPEFSPGMQIEGYRKELAHVLINCLANSRDAFEQHPHDHKMIILRAYPENEDTVIEVIDNAGGIDPQIIDKIFDPFYTTKLATNGTGLGLYMSRKIIQEHFKGSMEAENTENGVRIKIVLPQR